jgi:hypothetical protein
MLHYLSSFKLKIACYHFDPFCNKLQHFLLNILFHFFSIDNSEWMRNGDFSPNRFEAMQDAVNLVCGTKIQSNPENVVGLLTMAGKSYTFE